MVEKWRPLILALAFALMAVTAVSDERRVHNFEGGIGAKGGGITRVDIEPQHPDEWIYNWRYTFMFYLGDGSSFMFQFTYSKMTRLLDEYFYYLSYVDPEGRRIYYQSTVPENEYFFDPEVPAMRMGGQGWSGNYPEFRLTIDTPEFSANLLYMCRAPGWRPGEGPARFGYGGGDWFDQVVFIPWAEVSGEVVIKGKSRSVKGFGYAEYSVQNMMFFNHIEKIYSLRSFSEGHSICFMDHVTPEKYGKGRVTWLIIMKGGRIIQATDRWERMELETVLDPRRGLSYAKKLKIMLDEPDMKLEGEIETTALIEIQDVLDMMPSRVHKYTKGFRRPIYIRQGVKVKAKILVNGMEEKIETQGVLETCLVF